MVSWISCNSLASERILPQSRHASALHKSIGRVCGYIDGMPDSITTCTYNRRVMLSVSDYLLLHPDMMLIAAGSLIGLCLFTHKAHLILGTWDTTSGLPILGAITFKPSARMRSEGYSTFCLCVCVFVCYRSSSYSVRFSLQPTASTASF